MEFLGSQNAFCYLKNVLFEITIELFSFLKLVGKDFTSKMLFQIILLFYNMKEKRQTEHKAERRSLA